MDILEEYLPRALIENLIIPFVISLEEGFQQAASEGSVYKLKLFLRLQKAYRYKNDPTLIQKAMYTAIQHNHFNCVQFLCQSKAIDLNLQLYTNLDSYEVRWFQGLILGAVRNPFEMAISCNQLELAEYLRQMGADPSANYEGALMTAVFKNNLKAVEYLVEQCSTDLLECTTHVQLAIELQFYDIVKYLSIKSVAIEPIIYWMKRPKYFNLPMFEALVHNSRLKTDSIMEVLFNKNSRHPTSDLCDAIEPYGRLSYNAPASCFLSIMLRARLETLSLEWFDCYIALTKTSKIHLNFKRILEEFKRLKLKLKAQPAKI